MHNSRKDDELRKVQDFLDKYGDGETPPPIDELMEMREELDRIIEAERLRRDWWKFWKR